MSKLVEQRELRDISAGYCPDCGHRGFVLGPRGGSSVNVECGNVHCRSRFNIAQGPYTCAVVIAERIERQNEGGSDWGNAPRVRPPDG